MSVGTPRAPALSASERDAIQALRTGRERRVKARNDIAAQGEPPRVVNLLLEGWAYRYKQLADGRRQILSFLLPGEICDANVFLLSIMDHSVAALTDVRVSEIPPAEFTAAFADTGRASHFLWFSDLRTVATQREWTVSLGQRNARERVAHLICEVFHRLRYIGLTTGDECDFPLTQTDLAEALGLTAVHVNRMLQDLRADGLIELRQKRLRISDLLALEAEALFDPVYLHF